MYREDLEAEWYDDESDEDDGYRVPAALVMNHDDGRPVTLGQFVTHVHAYLARNMQEILSVKLEHSVVRFVAAEGAGGGPVMFPKNTRVFSDKVSAAERDGKVIFYVSLYALGQTSWTEEEFWRIRQGFLSKYGRSAEFDVLVRCGRVRGLSGDGM